MDKKASSSSQGCPHFKVGSGGYNSDAWRRDNYGKGGESVVHTDWSKFDRCDNPSARMYNTNIDKSIGSSKKKQ